MNTRMTNAEEFITRDMLTVTNGTSEWGGDAATVTVDHPMFSKYTYELKSTKGLAGMRERDRGHGIHIEQRPGRTWLGVSPGFNMDTAIEALITHLNDELDRHRAEWATMSSLAALTTALDGFSESLERNSRRDFLDEWANVRDAVAAVSLAIATRTEVDPPDYF